MRFALEPVASGGNEDGSLDRDWGNTGVGCSRPWLVLLALGLVLVLPRGAGAACKTDDPAAILDCLQWTYADRDTAAFAELLDRGFTEYNFGPDSTAMDLDASLHAASYLFHSTTSLQLEYLKGWRIRPWQTPDTWLLDSLDVKITLTTPFSKDGPPTVMYSKFNSLFLRRDPGPPARILITKWVRLPQPAPPPAPRTAADR